MGHTPITSLFLYFHTSRSLTQPCKSQVHGRKKKKRRLLQVQGPNANPSLLLEKKKSHITDRPRHFRRRPFPLYCTSENSPPLLFFVLLPRIHTCTGYVVQRGCSTVNRAASLVQSFPAVDAYLIDPPAASSRSHPRCGGVRLIVVSERCCCFRREDSTGERFLHAVLVTIWCWIVLLLPFWFLLVICGSFVRRLVGLCHY